MKRFLLDTGIASDFINRRHGVFEHAQQEVSGQVPQHLEHFERNAVASATT